MDDARLRGWVLPVTITPEPKAPSQARTSGRDCPPREAWRQLRREVAMAKAALAHGRG